MKLIISICLLLIVSAAHGDVLPDPAISPGAARVVTQHDLCTTSTKLVRNVPSSEKKAVFKEYGMDGNDRSVCKDGFEIDHIISLELGGSNDIKNLWPQNYCGPCGAHIKDKLENKLHALICSGDIAIEEAQQEISTDWVDSYNKHIGPLSCGD
jgi:hypothetical protein